MYKARIPCRRYYLRHGIFLSQCRFIAIVLLYGVLFLSRLGQTAINGRMTVGYRKRLPDFDDDDALQRNPSRCDKQWDRLSSESSSESAKVWK